MASQNEHGDGSDVIYDRLLELPVVIDGLIARVRLATESLGWEADPNLEGLSNRCQSTISEGIALLEQLQRRFGRIMDGGDTNAGHLMQQSEWEVREYEKKVEELNTILTQYLIYSGHFDDLQDEIVEAWSIRQAALVLQRGLDQFIPGATIRIILTPQQNALGQEVDNPIAQMLEDGMALIERQYEDFMSSGGKNETNVLTEMPGDDPIVREWKRSGRLINLFRFIPATTTRMGKGLAMGEWIKPLDWDLAARFLGRRESITLRQIKEAFPDVESVPILRDFGIGKVAIFIPKGGSKEWDVLDCPPELLNFGLSTIGRLFQLIANREENQKDLLSGLPLRRFFYEQAMVRFAQMEREGEDISFVMIDGDKFKNVNDTYGHDAGDLVIKTIASCLMEKLRHWDLAVRMGGEEFGILMSGKSRESAMALKRAKDAFEAIIFWFDRDSKPTTDERSFAPGCKRFQVTLSMGVYSTDDADVETLDEIMAKADERLYRAKKQDWRNRIRFGDGNRDILRGERDAKYDD